MRYDTYDPLNVLKPVAQDIWIVDGPTIRFGFFGIRLPFPTRTTLIRLKSGDLFVHSPGHMTEDLRADVNGLGRVAHLIAPNRIHYWWVGSWAAAYPDALAYAAPKVRERAAPHGIAFDRDLGDEPDPAWAGEIDQVAVAGSFLTEIVFFHRATRTLILTDLVQNYEAPRLHGPILRFLARRIGVVDPDGTMPVDLRATFRGRRAEVRAAVRQMIAWAPERVILAHGRWYTENGVAELRRAFRWVGDL